MTAEAGQLQPERSRQPGTIGGQLHRYRRQCWNLRNAGQLEPWTDSAGRLEQSRDEKSRDKSPAGLVIKGLSVKRKQDNKLKHETDSHTNSAIVAAWIIGIAVHGLIV